MRSRNTKRNLTQRSSVHLDMACGLAALAVLKSIFIHLAYAALICAIAVGAAYLLSQFTEAKTELVRHRVMGLFQ